VVDNDIDDNDTGDADTNDITPIPPIDPALMDRILRGREKEPWPPANYVEEFARRQKRLLRIRSDPALLVGAKEYYRNNPLDFLSHWGTVSEPRAAGGTDQDLTKIPFVPFRRQREFIQFLYELLQSQESGLVEKSRDMGATWVCCLFSVWVFLFWPGAAIGWGSRDADLVDKRGDPSSILEKIRIVLRNIPREFLPRGFSAREHLSYMRISNPESEAVITGDAGENIGRGGRSLVFFKDEAEPLTSKILTPTGFQTMADMVVGSRVIGANGRPCRVTQVKDCGVYDVYRITFSDSTSVECSPGHLWTVEDVYSTRKILTLSTAQLAENYRMEYKCGQVMYRYRVPLCSTVLFDKTNVELPLDPYLLGVLLGDGSVKNRHYLAVSTSDYEILEAFQKLLPVGMKVGGIQARSEPSSSLRGGKALIKGFQIINEVPPGPKRGVAGLIVESAGILGLSAHDKHVPNAYKFASSEDRLRVLQGLMDTDGTHTGMFDTTSRQLAEDVQFLAQSLGGWGTFRARPLNKCGNASYRVFIKLPDGMAPFRLKRKLDRYTKTDRPRKSIIDISFVDRRPVRCISVDAPDGLYLTDHCIVTHNSAHYKYAEMVEAALSDNALIQVDISSVGAPGNVFHRRRESGVDWTPERREYPKSQVRVFVMDWSDHPAKTQEWYEGRKKKATEEGLLHVFAQEIDRDYSASIEGVVINSEWVRSAVDAHLKLGFDDSGGWIAGLDVADEGGDTTALAIRKGVILREVREWGDRDTGVSTRTAVAALRDKCPVDLQYDSVGMGAGIKAEGNRLFLEKKIPRGLRFVPWNAGAQVLFKDRRVVPGDKNSPKNGDFYLNLKAQAWWNLARRFERTYRALNDPGFTFDVDDLISLPSSLPLIQKIIKELSQPTASYNSRMKLVIDKRPDGMRSPNLADAIVMAYWPITAGKPMKITPEILARAAVPMRRNPFPAAFSTNYGGRRR
jgi:hypothetical protein